MCALYYKAIYLNENETFNTVASLPIVREIKTVRAETKGASRRIQAQMRAVRVAQRALVDVLASVIVGG